MIAWPWQRAVHHHLAAAAASTREAERRLEETRRIQREVRALQPSIEADIRWVNWRVEKNHLGTALEEAMQRKQDETNGPHRSP